MSAHLQFGPEWMRKGPGKTNSAIGATGAGETAPITSPLENHISSTIASSKSSGPGNNKKHPSLGNLSATLASSGQSPLNPAVMTPSPGAFSFAAAAQGGSTKEPTTTHGTSTSSSSSIPFGSDGDNARYSKRLLSLYSTERGGKPSSAGQREMSDPTSPSQKKKSDSSSSGVGRSANASLEGIALPRSGSPGGEPRGLNARTVSSSHEKSGSIAQRPGLFQRGSNGPHQSSASALSPSMTFQSRDRDRHGAGIQGGVLSGVAGPLSSRRRKDSEPGTDSIRSPRTPMDAEHAWDQRKTNDAFNSARTRTNRTTTFDGSTLGEGGGGGGGGAAGEVAARAAPNVSSNGEVIETWSRFGGRRERLPGEGPIGPPADHSGGFARFVGHERKRDRHVSMTAAKRSSQSSDVAESKYQNQGEGQISSDVDFSKHATSVLDSLQLDDEEDEDIHNTGQQEQERAEEMGIDNHNFSAPPLPSAEWSPATQDWFYRDNSGQVQGPFKANLMQDWFTAKYFSNDLLLRRAEDEEFQTLGETLLLIGTVMDPFLIPPFAYANAGRGYENTRVVDQPVQYQQDPSHNLFLGNQQHQPQYQVNNPLGWPGNLDVLNHFGSGSGHSSPFATPQGHFAELDGTNRLRQRNQQEQYAEMIRQRELAEQRALHEQKAAQMAAIAMAQAQGRDPATLGLWGPGAMLGGNWNQSAPQSYPAFDRPYQPVQQQQQYEQMVQGDQSAWKQESYADGFASQQPDQEKEEEAPLAQQVAQANQPAETDLEVHSDIANEPALSIESQQSGYNAKPEVSAAQSALETEVVSEKEEGQEQVVQEEQAPEEVWPQSPSAVEFASEPFSEEQWKEESPSRGKKTRRDRSKQKTEEGIKQERTASMRTTDGVKVVSEEQFRKSQTSGKDSTQSGVQAPLSSWLPDTLTGAPTKAAPWANNSLDSPSGLSLREIQEAEARQAEARKAARQRLQMTTPLVSSSSGDSSLPSTLSWGLASSHANGREIASPSSTMNQNAPVWNASQAPKKTLMEIQEEERLRAQRVKNVQAAQSEGKTKAYADSASKMQLSNASSNNGTTSTWSVVGSSGKPTIATSVSSRPSKATTAPITTRSASNASISASSPWNSSSASSSIPNGMAAGKVTPRKNANGGVDGSFSSSPSPEFIKYCKDQLKGLSVKVDDFVEMLLSFPLDPSADVIEIIAESVYASSSTLDGRRFAADFVAKRKMDAGQGQISTPNSKAPFLSSASAAAAAARANGQAIPSPIRSASDVLKSSAPSNDGFGGFKVVKAKGAKKRV